MPLKEFKTNTDIITKWINTEMKYKNRGEELDINEISKSLISYNLSIIGVDIGVLFTEDEGLVKISFRSKRDIPINLLAARYFDGGGHINAAGGRCYLPIDKTIEKFKKCIEKFISEQSL